MYVQKGFGSLAEPTGFLMLIGLWAYEPPIKRSPSLELHTAVLELAGLGPVHAALLIAGWVAVLMNTTIAAQSHRTSRPQPPAFPPSRQAGFQRTKISSHLMMAVLSSTLVSIEISRLEIFHNTPLKYPRYSFKNVCAMHFDIYNY